MEESEKESENLGSSFFGLSEKKSALFSFGSVELWNSDFLWTILSSEFEFHSFSATFLVTKHRERERERERFYFFRILFL